MSGRNFEVEEKAKTDIEALLAQVEAKPSLEGKYMSTDEARDQVEELEGGFGFDLG